MAFFLRKRPAATKATGPGPQSEPTTEPLDEPARPRIGGAPPALDPAWYQPIPIDRPVYEFEAKPPARSTRPDTVCDGWATTDFTVRAAAVRGYDHRYRGLPRQDAVVIRDHQPTNGVVFAVADGVAAASRADIGAEVACQTAVAELSATLDRCPADQLPWLSVLQRVAARLTREASVLSRLIEPDPTEVERLMATMLVAGVVVRGEHGGVAHMVQIGDSRAWLLRRGVLRPVLRRRWDHDAPIDDPLPRLPAEPHVVTIPVPHGAAFIVGTDGIGAPLGNGTGPVAKMFAHSLPVPPSAIGLARLLDFSWDSFDDDRAMVVIWPTVGLDALP
jgi:hypothetical protein